MKLRSMLNTLYILGTEAEEGITLALGPVPHRNVAAAERRGDWRKQSRYGCSWSYGRDSRRRRGGWAG